MLHPVLERIKQEIWMSPHTLTAVKPFLEDFTYIYCLLMKPLFSQVCSSSYGTYNDYFNSLVFINSSVQFLTFFWHHVTGCESVVQQGNGNGFRSSELLSCCSLRQRYFVEGIAN